jgi:hypothetical protein
LLHCKVEITKAKGKAPKVSAAARKGGSRLLTFPKGDMPKGMRHKARKGWLLERQHGF